jgi:methyl-accepting chemotaxis protein
MAQNTIEDHELKEKNISSLKFRVTLFFVFFFMAIIGVFIITSVLQVNSVTRYICSQLGQPTVEQVQALVDGDAFEALVNSLDEDDPYYEKARLQMLEIKERVNCLYLYTMAPMDETIWRYIIDGSAPPDDEVHFSPLGSEEDVSVWDEAFFATIQAKTIQLGSVDYQEDWGTVVSTYGPIFNSSGELVGIVGCDLAGDSIAAWIRTQVFWQLGVVTAFVVLGLIVYLTLLRKINRSFA